MELKDLTKEQLVLINTDFGEDLEKQASAHVDAEYEKIAELSDVADSCYSYGAELAMQKIAEMEANYAEKEEGKEEGKEGKKEKKEEKKEEEAEKTASAMGNFILEGYWNTMMEKGAEFYEGDKGIYLEELCKEAGIDKEAANMMSYIKSMGKKSLSKGKELASKGKSAYGNLSKKQKAVAAGTGAAGAGFLAGRASK